MWPFKKNKKFVMREDEAKEAKYLAREAAEESERHRQYLTKTLKQNHILVLIRRATSDRP